MLPPEYGQALAFDQLRKVMQSGEAFIGFNEAAIDFPPTFKYDVLRSKRSKRHRSIKRLSRTPGSETQIHEKTLTEIEETPAAGPFDEDREDRSDGEQEYDGEAASVASTAYSTGPSKHTTDFDDDEHEEYFYGASSSRATRSTGALINKSLATAAVHRAKAKWMSLINSTSSSPGTPIFKRFKHKQHDEHRFDQHPDSPPPPPPSPPHTVSLPNSPPPEFKSLTLPPTPGQDNKPLTGLHDDKLLMPPRSLDSSKPGGIALSTRAQSTKSIERADQQEEEEEVEAKGVYDTSHKRRVPSWYVCVASLASRQLFTSLTGATVSSGNLESCLDLS